MIFNFRIISDEINNFRREIKIDAQATFLDLKNAICDAVGFRKDELSSFYICDDDWKKEKEIAVEDLGSASDQDVYLMDECVLEDYIDDEGQKLLYTFDYDRDRSLLVEMNELITGRDLRDPVCTLSAGRAPAQHVEDEAETAPKPQATNLKSQPSTLDDFDDPMYGDDDYDPDEFDENSFSELTEE